MASRRKSQSNFDPLAGKAAEGATLENVTNNIFGAGSSGVPQREVIKMIPIEMIQPDPAQPRRVVPSAIRAMGISDMGELFQRWMLAANKENSQRQYPDLEWDKLIDLDETLDIEDDNHKTRDYGPIAAALIRVVLLARSIKLKGQITPIRVAVSGRQRLLESGERRVYAIHLLHLFEPERYNKIEAREIEKVDIWRQAAENIDREDLNAIARARQFAILLMDLYRQEGTEFEPYDALVKDGCDRAYYAQVADGKKFTIPYGKADLICGAMGISSPQTLREIRAMLRVDDDIWNEADDYGYGWAWILDTDRLRRLREKEEKTRVVPDSIPAGDRVGYSTQVDDPHGENPEAGDEKMKVLTIEGTAPLVKVPDQYAPENDEIGSYPTEDHQESLHLTKTIIEIGFQMYWLLWRLQNRTFPRMNTNWSPILPQVYNTHPFLKKAVETYRDRDLGWGAKPDPAGQPDKPAQPVGDDLIRQAWGIDREEWEMMKAIRPGEITQSPIFTGGSWVCLKISPNIRKEIKGRRWSPRRETWLYKLDDTSVVEEAELLRYRITSDQGNAQPQNKDGVFVPGSGFVPNVGSASSSIPKPPFQPEPGDSYTPENGWVKGSSGNAAPNADNQQPEPKYSAGQQIVIKGGLPGVIAKSYFYDGEWKYVLEDTHAVAESMITGLAAAQVVPPAKTGNEAGLTKYEQLIEYLSPVMDTTRWKINSLLAVPDAEISLLQDAPLSPLRWLQNELDTVVDVLAEGLEFAAKLRDYVDSLIEQKETANEQMNRDFIRSLNEAAGHEE